MVDSLPDPLSLVSMVGWGSLACGPVGLPCPFPSSYVQGPSDLVSRLWSLSQESMGSISDVGSRFSGSRLLPW